VAPAGGIETPVLPEGVTDPGAATRDPVTPPAEVVYKNIAGEVISGDEEVTGSSSAAAPAVTPEPFDITVPPQEKNLHGKKDHVDSHPEVAPEDLPSAGPVPGKKSGRKG